MSPHQIVHYEQPLRWQARQSGYLSVTAGVLWLTRDGEPDDHVLQARDGLRVRAGDQLTLSAWHRGTTAGLRYVPDRDRGGLAALVAALAARGLRGLGEGALALARSADAMARRAQGCMASGESIASAGTSK